MEGWLGEERMREILNQDSFVCHKKTDFQCAGHMIIKGNENSFVNLAKRLHIKLDLKGNELVFNNVNDCIDHHS